MASAMENWDDDADFQGDFFAASQSRAPPSISSRVSVGSESIAGDDEWQMLLNPQDEGSKNSAIASAKRAGIPIPDNIPPSALLGGSIKMLGKKKSKPTVAEDDWAEDLEIPDTFNLEVKKKNNELALPERLFSPTTPVPSQEDIDTDWAEGSLGTRHGGTRREQRHRSSSLSAMSPSMGSCMTLESEDDDFGGLVLPDDAIDFSERLKKRKEAEFESPVSASAETFPRKAPIEQPTPKKQKTEDEEMAVGLDFGNTDLIDKRKRKLHPAIKIKESKVHPSPPRMPTTTVTFTANPASSRIPRPAHHVPSNTKLDPVYESMAAHVGPRTPRTGVGATNSQLLRSKRSAPALTSRPKVDSSPRPPVPSVPSTYSRHTPSGRVSSHGRHLSDQDRQSVADLRSASRQSQEGTRTPSRTGFRRDIAPAALARQVAGHRSLHVKKQRAFGDGSELDRFDDLPTSATKESRYVKEPTVRAQPRTLRHKPSMARMNQRDQMTTPQPQPSYPSSTASNTVPSTPGAPLTPRSTYFSVKPDMTPRFARDTAASRNAREQRLANALPKAREGGPLAPVSINWKAQVAARNPHNSPTSQRKKKGEGKQPVLIKQMSLSAIKNEKGMTYNPSLQRWEGNEHALHAFNNPSTASLPINKENQYGHEHLYPTPGNTLNSTHHQYHPHHAPAPQASPPRPALISQISTAGVRVERGMVFDPQQMKWLKLDPRSANMDPNHITSPGSVSIEEDEDPFAGLDDLKDEREIVSPRAGSLAGGENKENAIGARTSEGAQDDWMVGEEFDVGPSFIRRQRLEEAEWTSRTEKWIGPTAVMKRDDTDEGWKWEVREVAKDYSNAQQQGHEAMR